MNGPPDDIVFLPPPPGGFLISELTGGARYAKSQRWDLAQCIGNKGLDLAAILFNTPPQVEFFALLPDAVVPPPATQVVICGYPFAKSKAVLAEDRVKDLAPLDFQCATVLEPASASGLRWCQLAVDYPSIPGIVNPCGYSGSMVWYDRAGCGTLEELGERLSMAAAGVVTDYIGPKWSLRCTKIDLVIDEPTDIQRLPCALRQPGLCSRNFQLAIEGILSNENLVRQIPFYPQKMRASGGRTALIAVRYRATNRLGHHERCEGRPYAAAG